MSGLPRGPVARAILLDHARGAIGPEELALLLDDAPLSVRDADALSDILLGESLQPRTVTARAERTVAELDGWLRRPLEQSIPLIYFDAVDLPGLGSSQGPLGILVAVGITATGHRELIGLEMGPPRVSTGWRTLIEDVRRRGVHTVGSAVANIDFPALLELRRLFPRGRMQACLKTLRPNLLRNIGTSNLGEFYHLIKDAFQVPCRSELEELMAGLRTRGEAEAARLVEQSLGFFPDPLLSVPMALANTTWLHRVLCQLRSSLKQNYGFVSVAGTRRLAGARLRHLTRTTWAHRSFVPAELMAKLTL